MDSKTKALRSRHREWTGSKAESRALHKAIKNHKKLPTFTRQFKGKDPEFAKLTIEQYEKKYPTWDN